MLEIGAQGVAIAVGAPAVVMRSRDADRGAAGRRLRADGVVRQEREAKRAATVRASFGDERRAGLGGERRLLTQVDDPAERVGAIEGRRRTAQDLDRREAEDAVATDLIGIREALRQAAAIEEYRRLGGVRATEEERAHRAFARLLGGVDARGAAEEARQGRLAGFRRGGDIKPTDRRRGLGQRGGLPSFDHDRLGQPGGRLGQEEREEREHPRTIRRGFDRSTQKGLEKRIRIVIMLSDVRRTLPAT